MNKERRGFVLVSPVIVANNFILKGNTEEIEITPLKLQKLVYFLYAEFLKRTDEKLFTEQFETWSKGPVVPSIYTEFSSYGDNPIKTFAKDSQDKCFIVSETGVFKECIDKIWNKFKNYSGEKLSDITHIDGSAWCKAKGRQELYLKDEDIKNEKEYTTT